MSLKPFLLKVEESELMRWRAEAKGEKLSLAAWIRKQCEVWTVTIETGPTYERAAKRPTLKRDEIKMDMSTCPHNMMKAACPRCK